jgi:hypothetical protein
MALHSPPDRGPLAGKAALEAGKGAWILGAMDCEIVIIEDGRM